MQPFQHKHLKLSAKEAIEGEVAWKSPANIALIKYWGKKSPQLPQNPSLSFSLDQSYTTTAVTYSSCYTGSPDFDFYFEGKKSPQFAERIRKYIQSLYPEMPFLEQLNLKIESSNSFPHSSGIASSASAFSALALCLCSIEDRLFGSLPGSEFYRKASYLARLGSGSAARSLYEGISVWGKHPLVNGSSDEFAVPPGIDIHKSFKHLNDGILIVHSGSKKVSSSAGHHLMNGHPFAKARFEQANENMGLLLSSIESGDFSLFASVVESEALSLHAMMMTSMPAYMLLEPASLAIIKKIKDFREQKGHQLCFTIDAGPNIHLIYSEEDVKPVKNFIDNELLVYCEAENWIDDKMGNGPQELKQKI